MKQKLLLPLLLVLLTCLGVHAQDVVFDNFGNTGDGAQWSGVPTAASASTSTITKSISGRNYSLTVYSVAYLNNTTEQGLTIYGSSNSPAPGYITFPSFGKKVSKIEVKLSDKTFTSGKLALYNLTSATPDEAIETKNATPAGSTLTYVIETDNQASYAVYQLKNVGTGRTAIESVSVYYADGQTGKSYVTMSLSAYTATAELGRTFTAPKLTTNPSVNVSWSSSKPSVATVDASGAVTLVGAGKTVIKATYNGNNNYFGESIAYTLTVIDPLSADGITYTFSEMGFTDNQAVGTSTPISYTHEQGIVTITFAKAEATNQPNYGLDGGYVRFYSKNTLKVAAIDGYIIDKVEFISSQTRNYLNGATFSAGTFAGASNGKAAVWTLLDQQVSEATLTADPTTSPALFTQIKVYLALPKLKMEAAKNPLNYVYGTRNLNALNNITFADSNASKLAFTYESSDPSVVSVAANGAMTLLKAGSSDITVKFAGNDYYAANEATFTVNVTGNPVPTIDFTGNVSKLDLNLVTDGQRSTYDLKANTTVKLGNNTITEGIQFASDNAAVASVDATTGVITAHSAGTAVITVTVPATAGRDEAKANFTVTVIDNRVAPAISFAEKSEAYYIGVNTFPMAIDLQTLTGATYDNVNVSVAFDPTTMGSYSDGKINLQGTAGTAVVTVTYPASEVNLEATASYKVLVVNPEDGISLNPASLGIQNGFAVTTVVSDTKLVTYTFKGASYFMASGNNAAYVNLYANSPLTITAADGYVIDHVEFTGAGFTETNNSVSAGKLVNGNWSFDGLNESTATIINTGTTAVKIENVTVYLRKPIFVISVDQASISQLNVEADSDAEAVTVDAAKNFKVTLGTETLTNVALTYAIYGDQACTTAATVGTINAETGIVTLTKGAIGTNYVQASFNGDATYGKATPAVFSLVVTEKEPVVFTFNTVEAQNIFADKTLALSDIIASMTAAGTDVATEEGTLTATTDNEAVTYSNGNLVIAASEDYSNADVAPETVTVTVTFTPNETKATELAESTGVFTFQLTDQRQTPVFAYAKSYNLKAADFVAPQPFADGYALTAGDVVLTSTNDKLVKDGQYAVEGLVGVQKGVVTATFNGNADYKPAKTTFDLTVTGAYMTVAQFNSDVKASDSVVVEGYIIGSADNNGNVTSDYNTTNLVIADTKDADASSYVIVSLNAPYTNTYNLQNNPQFLNAFVQITGTAINYRGRVSVGTITAMNAMKAVNIDLTEAEIDVKGSVTIPVPAGYNGTLDVTVTKNGETASTDDYTVAGYRYTFLADGTYTINVKGEEIVGANGWQAVDHNITVTVNGKVQFLPEGRTFIASDMLKDGKYYVKEDSASITYSIDGGAEQIYNSADGISFGDSTSGDITFKATVNGDSVEETYKYEFNTYDVNVGFIVAPTSGLYGAPVSYQFSVNGDIVATGAMTLAGQVAFDKDQYVATIAVPASAFADYKGGNVRDEVSSTNTAAFGEDNVFFQQPDKVNIVKPYDSESSSPFSIVFFSSESDEEVAFTQTKVAYGSIKQTYDGTEQTILNGMNYSQSDVYTPIYVFDYTTMEKVAEVNHSNQSSEINLWIGNIKLAKGTKFFYATALGNSSEPAGTFFGAANANQTVEDFWEGPAATAYKSRANSTGMELKATTDISDVNPITFTGANGDNLGVSLLLAKGNGNEDGTYVAGYGPTSGDIMTEVSEIADDAEGEVMWFNLQGERIAEPEEGIVIRVQGNKSQKIYIKK